MNKPFTILLILLLTFCHGAVYSQNSFILLGGYEKTLDTMQGGWKFQTEGEVKDFKLSLSLFHLVQHSDGDILPVYQSVIEVSKDIDLNRKNFLKFEFSFRNQDNFDPLLSANRITLRESLYHLFDTKNYFKLQLIQQGADYLHTDIIDYYRVGLFAKIIRRASLSDSIFLSFQSMYTMLPNWEIEDEKKRSDFTSTILLSFSRYLTRNLTFTLKYQILYNYSSTSVSQLDIKYFYLDTPDSEETKQLTADFYNYFLHILSGEFMRYFSRNLIGKLSLVFESKEYTQRRAYNKEGTQKNEFERDFNFTGSLALIFRNFPFKHVNLVGEFKYENKSSNNDYDGFYYYNIKKYGFNLNFFYEF
ncbi:hypothetical protein KAU32_04795 [bacterium]|nr:hypothetical protein [bacterium]